MSSAGAPDPSALFPPVFATNRPERGEAVANEINRLLAGMRGTLKVPPDVAIATAYLNPAGMRRVEVRRFTEGFLHGKAFLVDQDLQRAVLAGSSNLTFAGLMTNAELNLGYPSGTHTHLVQGWFEDFWQRSEEYPLDRLYASRWDPHTPWLVFLRMLWELYGRDCEQDEELAPTEQLQLTGFQRDGVQRLLRLLEANGGVLVADEVGLGKTFIAAEVIRKAVEQKSDTRACRSPRLLLTGVAVSRMTCFGWAPPGLAAKGPHGRRKCWRRRPACRLPKPYSRSSHPRLEDRNRPAPARERARPLRAGHRRFAPQRGPLRPALLSRTAVRPKRCRR